MRHRLERRTFVFEDHAKRDLLGLHQHVKGMGAVGRIVVRLLVHVEDVLFEPRVRIDLVIGHAR